MAFNAGAIEATLTLNRSPFTAGLRLAKQQGQAFAREKFEAKASIEIDDASLSNAKRQLRDFARESRQATAKVNVDRLMFDRLVKDLREFGRQTYTARARVDVDDAISNVRRLRDELRGLGDESVRTGNGLNRMGDQGSHAFGRVHGAARLVMATLPLLLPVAGSAIVGVTGLLGGLVGMLATAGLGAAAFAAVAIPAFTKIKDAVAAGQAEVDKLPNGLRQAATAFQGLNKAYEEFVNRNQESVGFAMAAGFNAATTALRTLDPLVKSSALGFQRIAEMADKYFASPHWKNFVNFMAAHMVPTLTGLFEVLAYATRGVMNLIVAFQPFTDWLLAAMVQGMKDFAEWTSKLGKNPEFIRFLELAKESLQAMLPFLGSVINFLFQLSIALAPVGNAIMKFLTDVFNGLAKLPPEWLAAIGLGLSGIVAALVLGAGGPASLFIGVLLGVAAALTSLYDTNDKFRGAVDGLVSDIQTKLAPSFNQMAEDVNTKIAPAWQRIVDLYQQNLGPVLSDLWTQFKDNVLPALGEVGEAITGNLIPGFLELVESIEPFVTFMTEQVGKVVVDAIRFVAHVFEDTLKTIGKVFEVLGDIFRGDWDEFWKDIKDLYQIQIDFMKEEWERFWPDIQTTLEEEGQEWKTEWEKLWKDAGTVLQEEYDIWQYAWNEFWGNHTYTQEEGIRKHKGAWQTMVDEVGTMLDEEWQEWATWYDGLWDKVETRTDGSTVTVKGSWNQWLDQIGERFNLFTSDISTLWNDFWTWISTEQETSQDTSQSSWNTFWTDVGNWAAEQWRIISNGWADFWGGTITHQDGSQRQVEASWNNWLEQMGRNVSAWWAEVTTGWNTFWGGVGQRFEDAKTLLIAAATTMVNQLGAEWRKLGNLFRDPINWVINVVLNNGLLNAWNTVMGWIGQPGLSVGRIPELPAYAEGGRVTGPGNGTSDSILARVSNGEYIMPADVTSRHRYFLDALRAGQPEAMQAAGGTAGGLAKQYPKFAAGGAIEAGQNWARSQHGKPYIWGGVGPAGYDCSGFMSAITNVLLGRSPHSRVGTTGSAPWSGFTGGLTSAFGIGYFKGNPGHMAGTLGGLNVEAGGSPSMTKAGSGAAGANSGQFSGHMSLPQVGGEFTGGGLIAQLVSWWSQVGDRATALFNGLVPQSIPGFGGPIGSAAVQFPKALIGKALEALRDKLLKLMTTIYVQGSGTINASDKAVVEQVQAVAARYGWGPGSAEWQSLFLLISKESGWNPNAANPTSSARGLFQKMTSIHGPVEGTAAGQAEWGLNYIKGRYGTPSAAWRFHQANGYYDGGGILPPGVNLATNLTGRREYVNTPDQVNNLFNAGQDLGRSETNDAALQAIIAQQSNAMVAEKLDTLIELLERRGAGATIHMTSNASDANEVARATVLGLRLN